MPDELLDGLSVEDRSSGWKKHLEAGAEAYLLLESEQVIGVLEISSFRGNLERYKSCAEIPVCYLLPEKTGQSFGFRLMDHAMAELKSRQIAKVAVWVLERNARAIRFYEKAGFVCSGEVKRHAPSGLTELLYLRNLQQV